MRILDDVRESSEREINKMILTVVALLPSDIYFMFSFLI